MNLQKLVSMLLVTIITTSNIYAAQCINCVATINHQQSSDSDNMIVPSNVKTQEDANSVSTINDRYSNDKDNPNYIIPLDDEPSNIEIAEDNTPDIEYEDEENNSIVLIDETQNNLDNNHSILENQTMLYACDDEEHNVLICDNISKVCECV